MFQHITHYNKNMEQIIVELLMLKFQQQHEGKKLELGTICKFVIQKMETLRHQL